MKMVALLIILWIVGSYLLWGIQSRADGHVITIGRKDRAIALLWLPLCIGFAIWGLILWAWDKGRCV